MCECVLNESLFYLGSQGPSLVFNKRKKLEIKAVFNADEDDTAIPKKRKLVPLGINWHMKRVGIITVFSIETDYGDELSKKEKEPKNTEEKRKNIKSLIEKIPTDKASLFAHPVEWSLVDNVIYNSIPSIYEIAHIFICLTGDNGATH